MLRMVIGGQEAWGRIGMATGRGLAAVIKQHYSLRILRAVVLLTVVANIINIGADIAAVAAAARLVVPAPAPPIAVLFTGLVLPVEIRLTYRPYPRLPKLLPPAPPAPPP